jgi:hypothetical protein
MNLSKLIISACVIIIFMVCFQFDVSAQISFPIEPCGGPFDPCVPIDGGAIFLLGAGIAYGSKKVLENKKKAE